MTQEIPKRPKREEGKLLGGLDGTSLHLAGIERAYELPVIIVRIGQGRDPQVVLFTRPVWLAYHDSSGFL